MTGVAVTSEFEQHRHQVYGWAYRLLGRHHDALDVAQDVFLRWLDQASHEAPQHPRAWLRRVTVNRSIDLLRRRAAHGDEGLESATARQEPGLEERELRWTIGEALRDLSDAQRNVLVAEVYDGLTFAQIATEQQVTIPTVKTHYLRAVRSMRAALERQWSPDDAKGADDGTS